MWRPRFLGKFTYNSFSNGSHSFPHLNFEPDRVHMHFLQAAAQKHASPEKTCTAMTMLTTVAPTPLILFCASILHTTFVSAPTQGGVCLGIPTRPWILWYISIQNCTTNHMIYMNVLLPVQDYHTENFSREEATHILETWPLPLRR